CGRHKRPAPDAAPAATDTSHGPGETAGARAALLAARRISSPAPGAAPRPAAGAAPRFPGIAFCVATSPVPSTVPPAEPDRKGSSKHDAPSPHWRESEREKHTPRQRKRKPGLASADDTPARSPPFRTFLHCRESKVERRAQLRAA